MNLKEFLMTMKRPAQKVKAALGPDFPDVYVRAMNCGEITRVSKIEDSHEVTYWTVRFGACNADGSDVFTDDDIPIISKMNLPDMLIIADEIKKLSTPKEPAEIEKN